jgi:hypothetical protein
MLPLHMSIGSSFFEPGYFILFQHSIFYEIICVGVK